MSLNKKDRSEYFKAYKSRNKDKIKAQTKEYISKNKDIIKEKLIVFNSNYYKKK